MSTEMEPVLRELTAALEGLKEEISNVYYNVFYWIIFTSNAFFAVYHNIWGLSWLGAFSALVAGMMLGFKLRGRYEING